MTEDVLKHFDPTDANAASEVAYASMRLLRTICEAFDRDDIRMPKDGSRLQLQRDIRDLGKSLRLYLHSDELLTADESQDDITLSRILGKLFCKDGRELPHPSYGMAKRHSDAIGAVMPAILVFIMIVGF